MSLVHHVQVPAYNFTTQNFKSVQLDNKISNVRNIQLIREQSQHV